MKPPDAAPRSATSAPPAAERVSVGVRAAYGSSAFAENLAINSVNQLANPVFNLTLGVSPVLSGPRSRCRGYGTR